MRRPLLKLVCILAGTLSLGAQSNDQEAIKNLLHQETVAFYDRDLKAWQSHWVHSPDVTSALISATGYRYFRGWNDVSARVTKSIEANPKRAKVEVREANVSIRQMGNLAWAKVRLNTEV